MPVDARRTDSQALFQREQYSKGGLGRWYWDWRDSFVLNYIAQEDQNILDLGCGEGITLERLLRRFPRSNVQGIDIMPENIEICKSHRLPVRLGNLQALDLPDSSQDCVLLLEVIEHLIEPESAIREICRVLRPGGKLLVLFPNDRLFFLTRICTLRLREAFYDPGHVRQWTLVDMVRLLSSFDLCISALRMIPFYFWVLSLHGLVVASKKGVVGDKSSIR